MFFNYAYQLPAGLPAQAHDNPTYDTPMCADVPMLFHFKKYFGFTFKKACDTRVFCDTPKISKNILALCEFRGRDFRSGELRLPPPPLVGGAREEGFTGR